MKQVHSPLQLVDSSEFTRSYISEERYRYWEAQGLSREHLLLLHQYEIAWRAAQPQKVFTSPQKLAAHSEDMCLLLNILAGRYHRNLWSPD